MPTGLDDRRRSFRRFALVVVFFAVLHLVVAALFERVYDPLVNCVASAVNVASSSLAALRNSRFDSTTISDEGSDRPLA